MYLEKNSIDLLKKALETLEKDSLPSLHQPPITIRKRWRGS